MPVEFIKCEKCGKIFGRSEEETLCPACREVDAGPKTPKELLRIVRNYIRDVQARGALMTLEQVAEETGVDYATIWEFIQRGDIDLARFDDPQVKSFLLQRRREQDKNLRHRVDEIKTAEPEQKKSGGFHLSDPDKRDR